MYSSGFSYNPEKKIEYSETDEKKQSSVYFILENLGAKKSRLTVELYLKKNLLMQTMFSLMMKKKMEQNFKKSLENLDGLLKEIKVPVELRSINCVVTGFL